MPKHFISLIVKKTNLDANVTAEIQLKQIEYLKINEQADIKAKKKITSQMKAIYLAT